MTIKSLVFSSILLFSAANIGRATELGCTTAPCVSSNLAVTGSSTTMDAQEFSISGGETMAVLSAGYYSSGAQCSGGSKLGIWESSDPGVGSFTGGCVTGTSPLGYRTDPSTGHFFDALSLTWTTLFAGGEGSDSNDPVYIDGRVIYKDTTNGTSWGSDTETSKPIAFEGTTSGYGYFPDFDGFMIGEDSNGTNQSYKCAFSSWFNVNSATGDAELDVAHKCPFDTGTWSTVDAYSKPAADVIEFPRMFENVADGEYLTFVKCTSGTSKCAGSSAGSTVDFYLVKSTDAGSTWGSPVKIGSAALPAGGTTCETQNWATTWGCLQNTGERMTPVVYLGRYNETQNPNYLVAVYETYNSTHSALVIGYRTSTDGGSTWSSESLVDSITNGRDQFHPCVSGDASGGAEIFWLDRRNDSNNKKYDVYSAHIKTDGTINQVQKVSSSISDPSKTHLGSPFLGDYIGCSNWYHADGTLYNLVAWPDRSNNTNSRAMIAAVRVTP